MSELKLNISLHLFHTYNSYIYSFSYLSGFLHELQLVTGLVLTSHYLGTFDGLTVFLQKAGGCKGGKHKAVVGHNVQYNGFFVIGVGAQCKFYDYTDAQKDDILNFYIFLSFFILALMFAILLTSSFMVWLDLPRLRKHYYTKRYYPLLLYFLHLGGFLLVVVGGGLLFCFLTVYCMDVSLYLYFFSVYLVFLNIAYEYWNKVRKADGLLTGTVGDFLKVKEDEKKDGDKVGKGDVKGRKGRKGSKGPKKCKGRKGRQKWTRT